MGEEEEEEEEKYNNNLQQIGNFRQHKVTSFSMKDKEIEQNSVKMSWIKGDPSTFRVRDIGYFTKNKSKKQSEGSLYEIFGVDAYKVDHKVRVKKLMDNINISSNISSNTSSKINIPNKKSKNINIGKSKKNKKDKKKKSVPKSLPKSLAIPTEMKEKENEEKSVKLEVSDNDTDDDGGR